MIVGRQELLELQYIKLMEELGPMLEATGRTTATPTGRRCFDVHLARQVTNAVEMVPLRWNNLLGRVEVLMLRRSPEVGTGNPPAYAGRWHTPGCMQMWGMNPRAGLNRVMQTEIRQGDYVIIESLAPDPDTKRSDRGWEMPLVYMVSLTDAPAETAEREWFPVSDLRSMYCSDQLINAQFESFLERVMAWVHVNKNSIAR